jgi:hypothetical protein
MVFEFDVGVGGGERGERGEEDEGVEEDDCGALKD